MTGPPAATYAPPCATCGQPTHAYCPACMAPACNHCLADHRHRERASVGAWAAWGAFVLGLVALVTWQAWL